MIKKYILVKNIFFDYFFWTPSECQTVIINIITYTWQQCCKSLTAPPLLDLVSHHSSVVRNGCVAYVWFNKRIAFTHCLSPTLVKVTMATTEATNELVMYYTVH